MTGPQGGLRLGDRPSNSGPKTGTPQTGLDLLPISPGPAYPPSVDSEQIPTGTTDEVSLAQAGFLPILIRQRMDQFRVLACRLEVSGDVVNTARRGSSEQGKPGFMGDDIRTVVWGSER